MSYAENTDVPVERSRMEIERTVRRYGASGFISGWQGSQAFVAFELRDRRVKFTLPLPAVDEKRFCEKKRYSHVAPTSPEERLKLWEQACRQRWRALSLAVKAKLEAVDSGIATFEEEFLAYICLPDGETVGQKVLPGVNAIYSTGAMRPLLPA